MNSKLYLLFITISCSLSYYVIYHLRQYFQIISFQCSIDNIHNKVVNTPSLVIFIYMHDSNYTNIFFILSHLCEQFFT